MKTSTKYFGEIEYDADDIIEFPKGLFAFEEEKRFLLLPFAGSEGSLLCLQSEKTPELAFVVMDPFSLHAAYEPALQQEDLAFLEAEDVSTLCFYVLCVVKNPVAASTVNLKCPVVINGQNRRAVQVILEDGDYNMRHSLAEFGRQVDGKC